jgi:hypothetical protein
VTVVGVGCLCEGLITRPEESYRVWCVLSVIGVLDNEEAVAHLDCCAVKKKRKIRADIRTGFHKPALS